MQVTPPAERDLAHRQPVWAALSELYLDSELSPDGAEHLAQTLAASPYSRGELQTILLTELHPALLTNLLSVAGVWTGFDPAWLEARILARRSAMLRWPSRLLPLRRAILARAASTFARVEALRHVTC